MNKQSALRNPGDSPRILAKQKSWVSPREIEFPTRSTRNSDLRLACIVGGRLLRGLAFEGEVFPLNPRNFRQVLRFGRPNILIIESAQRFATGNWHRIEHLNSPWRSALTQCLELARTHSIPSVFWFTRGHEYVQQYLEFSRLFDFVFCADPKSVQLMLEAGISAELLLPCAQPALHNPFRQFHRRHALRFNILFDGWADLERYPENLQFLLSIRDFGLSIIESRYRLFRKRLQSVDKVRSCVKGCVSARSRLVALKYANSYLSMEQTISSETEQQWLALEAAACRVPIIHLGTLAETDVRKGMVLEQNDPDAAFLEFTRIEQDPIYRDRLAHLAWRKAHSAHTFAHRLRTMCQTVGIEHGWKEFPLISIISPTNRLERLPDCIENYERQSYPAKELVIVFNLDDEPASELLGELKHRKDIKIGREPTELFAGACMNQGHLLAGGEYCFRFDDDDYYATNYALDMVYHARSVGASLFGKPVNSCYRFDGDDSIIRPVGTDCELVTVRPEDLGNGVRFSGNSISGTRRFFLGNPYNESAQSATDVFMALNSDVSGETLAITDALNLVSQRRADPSTHTWKIEKKQLMENSYVAAPNSESIII